ncbi:MAG TPA: glycosyltransferase family 4 protein [Xanthobacteraceae bacterium]|jgi:UDP-N-acetylmuramyl pentapeptide phosphotransferase/UDP-N-acetylglucosamine-1-phosphate transferase
MIAQTLSRLVVLAPAALAALLLCYGAILLLRPWLARHAVAQPNARSSHSVPVPQGGGIGVVIATLAVTAGVILLSRNLARGQAEQLLFVSAGAILLTVLGAMDDIRALPAAARLLVQSAAVAAVVIALPEQIRALPELPWWLDRACLLIGGVWFVNLTNFMDGIDWMTVAEVVPVTGAMLLLGIAGTIDLVASAAAAALLGAMLGFAPFNKPVAQLFLGDSGSLPVGLILAWLLMLLAGEGHRAAALILPLYYLADTTVTLLRRLANREPFWQSHRTHFYQRATDNGFTVPEIVGRVLLLNLALAALALTAVAVGGVLVPVSALAGAAALVAMLLTSFSRAKPKR